MPRMELSSIANIIVVLKKKNKRNTFDVIICLTL